ncbi:ABC transporter substrate-binding protein [Allonocardiopsis opalescens]|uniref:Probable sugar-binding periplasmic protein n=1 Tax=Allonocardiopsis opalescens TaxID=1144618 RepID=A0A2T0Q0M1_9ACTN|nr:ABC transporter substrate-binding protein [Allonocardiopsis opalescens]PRX97223.1 carbohydrate ABC transporter substrate-binding protein (CUT1 family) [Allonocardiopsis opalescens]
MRRGWTAALAISLAGVLTATACGGSGGEDAEGSVEVFSWWTGGGEAAGLDALIERFEADNAGIAFNNAAVAGGSGTNAQGVLESRLQANEPPDSFQGHAGAELMDYIEAGYLEPLTEFYAEQGLNEVFPPELLEQITLDGEIYSVPVNIHRSNVLWYNPGVLEEAGVEPPTTLAEFEDALATVEEETDAIPLSLGAQWTADHLLESILLASLGTEGYNALWQPGADWSTPEVTEALETFDRIYAYTNTDAGAADWQEASQAVVDGDAAFNIMGDWALSLFQEVGAVEGEDYGYVPTPGTDGTYLWLSDSFTLPVNAPNPEGAQAWLELVSSQEGQDIFNPLKGSIPARTDADASLYEGYLADALTDWQESTMAPSYQHGAAANNRQKSGINDAVGVYIRDGDVAALQEALVTAAGEAG